MLSTMACHLSSNTALFIIRLVTVRKYWGHIFLLLGGVDIPYLQRDPEAEPFHRVEGSVSDRMQQVHPVLAEVPELCDRVGMGLHVSVFADPLERILWVKPDQSDGVFRTSCGCCRGVGWWS